MQYELALEDAKLIEQEVIKSREQAKQKAVKAIQLARKQLEKAKREYELALEDPMAIEQQTARAEAPTQKKEQLKPYTSFHLNHIDPALAEMPGLFYHRFRRL